MITKTKISIAALTISLCGWGAYELFRTKSSKSDLNQQINNPGVYISDERENDLKNDENLAKDTNKDQATESKEKQGNVSEPGAESTKTSASNSKQEKPSGNPDAPKSEPKPTYRDHLLSNNPDIKLIGSETSIETIYNTLLHKMLPSHNKSYLFYSDQMFKGNYAIIFMGQHVNGANKKSLYIYKERKVDAEALKSSCTWALKKIKPEDKKDSSDSQVEKLKTWCSILSIKDVLLRHKFKFPATNEEWKKILASNWIKNNKYHNKQSLFTNDEMQKLKENSKENEKIQFLKNKCEKTLSEPFQRSNFPATKDFLGNGKKADTFQEVALFCTVPITAETYVKENMKGELNTKIPEELKNDYCHDTGKNIQYYKGIKTTDPMEGKSFWCAVRMIHNEKDGNGEKYK